MALKQYSNIKLITVSQAHEVHTVIAHLPVTHFQFHGKTFHLLLVLTLFI